MTIGLLLSILFFALDYTGKVDWEWWQIILPSLIEVGLYVLWFLVVGLFTAWAVKD